MKHYNVSETFKLLKEYKITSNKESVRRWLRNNTIKGIAPASRKEGWLIREDDLYTFIHSRLPDEFVSSRVNTTSDVCKTNREEIRTEMWWELVNKFLFEDYIEPKKKQVQACIMHSGYTKEFGKEIWDIISNHKLGYANPRVPYLLDAFLFNGKRILLDNHYESLEERILFPLIEEIRKDKVKG